ncbi:MAG TPA: alpha/beta hydrolase [Devosia sp.]|nr:alpha/beta hydrolase [Devosia sp.]
MHFIEIGKGERPEIVFAHGWARNHRDFIPAAEALTGQHRSMLVDFPGFGATPRPAEGWTTKDYADHAAAFLREKIGHKVVWVGHSFGGRVGLRLGVNHPDVLKGLILVSAAGIPMQRSWWRRQRGKLRQAQFRMLRARAKDEAEIAALEKRFGSADYVQSRELGLRDIFLNTVREDQSADLPKVKVPTWVLGAANDTETPPEMGRRMAGLIPGARFLLLPEFDHISVLFRGHHVIALRAKELLEA